jgi:predicted nucleic acid-binding protein
MFVFDASTLILLAKITLLETFVTNFPGEVFIPKKVKDEILQGKSEEILFVIKLIETGKIKIVKIRESRQTRKLMTDFNIASGEAEAILLALKETGSLIGTDDRNAIRACKILKIRFTTAVAVLIRIFEKNLIDKEDALIKLQKLKAAARYRQAIIEDAQKQITRG